MRDYGKLLREYRNQKGLSQNELSKMIGVTQPFLSQLEAGKVEIFAESLKEKVEELLGIKGQTAEDVLARIVESVEQKESKEDMINSPKHYKIPGCDFEVIDLIDAFTEDIVGGVSVRIGNIVKYLARAEKKNGNQDYEKAKKYTNMILDLGVLKDDLMPRSLDDIAKTLKTDWFTIISGVCDGMPLKKALLVNECFRLVASAEYIELIKKLDLLLEQ